uniref:diacylglycerol O-acyltransferase n=1 Tax=Chaetoceros debilis TaxID=122233 RepID=A0A7S3Q517_9STRA
MKSLQQLLEKKQALEDDLVRIKLELQIHSKTSQDTGIDTVSSTSTFTSTFTSTSLTLSKSGYLSKWQDRQIGWGGTKWDLRFVRLERGRLSYFLHHNDVSPRYILTLKNCAVRDDGAKPNKIFKGTLHDHDVGDHHDRHEHDDEHDDDHDDDHDDEHDDEHYDEHDDDGYCYGYNDADLRTPGAFYHVFSVYQRPSLSIKENTSTSGRGTTASASASAENDEEDHIVPLLRFSTENYAEKMLYFAPPAPKIKRQPSHMNLNKDKNSAKSNSKHTSGYPPSKPMHRTSEPSYLSDEAPMQNYRGLLNLALIILVFSNFRILLSTTREYGFVLTHLHPNNARNFVFYSWEDILNFPLVYGMALLNVFVVFAYCIELYTSRKIVSERFGTILHIINTNAALFIPIAIIWYQMESPITGLVLLMSATVLWMKLVSYAHANSDYRHHPERSNHDCTDFISHVDEASKGLRYPSNITLPNIYYFWFAPTLTYQIVFPRLAKRNKLRLFSLIMRLFVTNIVALFLMAQVIRPTLASLIKKLENGESEYSVHIFVDYLLKLGITSTYLWLLLFYGFFHVFLNVLAEVLKFGDRVFYRDWWNSSNLSSYWRLWNLPVHYWLVRHLYFPCIRNGISKKGATFMVFLFSAIMHELIISIPFHMIKTYAFLGMMSQIPLIIVTKKLDKMYPGSSMGNIIFWLSFCIVGQPMAVILYTIDYWKISMGLISGQGGNARDEL